MLTNLLKSKDNTNKTSTDLATRLKSGLVVEHPGDISISEVDTTHPIFKVIAKLTTDSETPSAAKPSLESRVAAIEEALTDILLSQMEV